MDAVKTGSFLATLRKSKGYTQQDVADMLNISNKTVSRWEKGVGYPEITMLPVIAEIYGVTTDELLAGERIIKENSNRCQLQIKERKKYFLLTAETRFDIFCAAAMVVVIAEYANIFLSYFPPSFLMILSIAGLIVLLVGYLYSVKPLKAYSELFDTEKLFSLKQRMFQKIFLWAMIFLFATQKLYAYKLYWPTYYFPRIISIVLLAILWNIMQTRLSFTMKETRLFNKLTAIVLCTGMIIMVAIVLINWYVVSAFGRGYDDIFAYLSGVLEVTMAIVVAINLMAENKKCKSLNKTK